MYGHAWIYSNIEIIIKINILLTYVNRGYCGGWAEEEGYPWNTLTLASPYILLFQWPVSVQTARTSEKISRLDWGAIINSNINKKNIGKILEIKYNQVKWASALVMGNPVESCGLRN